MPIKKILISFLVGGTIALGSGAASASQNVLELCADDIELYCADVVPGDGRVIACLYAHTATLTESCHAATGGTGRLLEGFFDRMAEAAAACREDIKTHCANVQAGAAFDCLQYKSAELSAACATELEGFQ